MKKYLMKDICLHILNKKFLHFYLSHAYTTSKTHLSQLYIEIKKNNHINMHPFLWLSHSRPTVLEYANVGKN